MTSDHPICQRCNDRLCLKNSPYCRRCGQDVQAGNSLTVEPKECVSCQAKFYPSDRKLIRCGACRRARSQDMRDKYRSTYRQQRIDRTFSYEPGEFERKLKEQDNRCACCGVEFADLAQVENMLSDRVPVPYNDHDHSCCGHRASVSHPTCGKCNRGLVCLRCNVLLGYAEDSIEVLQGVIKYLEAYNR